MTARDCSPPDTRAAPPAAGCAALVRPRAPSTSPTGRIGGIWSSGHDPSAIDGIERASTTVASFSPNQSTAADRRQALQTLQQRTDGGPHDLDPRDQQAQRRGDDQGNGEAEEGPA